MRSTGILAVAKDTFGFERLRPGQGKAIEALLEKRDALIVMPTGSGKSAIYQIAGILLPGSVLVVSPLIALQKDQVDAINSLDGRAKAVAINSTLKASELQQSLDSAAHGCCKFIFLAPEQLHKEETLELLEEIGISLIVIDEAHCISEWGHDFRPDYLQLGRVVERLRHPATLALTATATEPVRQEIVDRLGLQQPHIFVGGFDRPNIHLRVDHFKEATEKLEAVIHQARWADKPGIIYTATRKSAEQIMHGLEQEGIKALFYHGGLKGPERHHIQNQFMAGDADVIVATNAFGMGIDKADVRFIFHHDTPDSLDAYYQEIGRAGRDGEKADAVLFFRKQDIGSQAFHTGSGNIDEEDLDRLAGALAEEDEPVTPREVAEKTGLSTRKVTAAIQQLEDTSAVEVLASGEVQAVAGVDLPEAARQAAEHQEERKEAKKRRLEQMRAYADTSACRREHLLRYFGEEFSGPCNYCDNCEARNPDLQVDPSLGTRREVA